MALITYLINKIMITKETNFNIPDKERDKLNKIASVITFDTPNLTEKMVDELVAKAWYLGESYGRNFSSSLERQKWQSVAPVTSELKVAKSLSLSDVLSRLVSGYLGSGLLNTFDPNYITNRLLPMAKEIIKICEEDDSTKQHDPSGLSTL